MAHSSSPKIKALIQNCQRTWPHSSPRLSWQDDELPEEKGLFWRQPYKSQIFPESPLMTCALPLLHSPSHWGLMVNSLCTQAAVRERELSCLNYKYNLQKVSSVNAASFFIKEKEKSKTPQNLKKHYCNPGLWEIKHIAQSKRVCFA